jgi:hypothetical protein
MHKMKQALLLAVLPMLVSSCAIPGPENDSSSDPRSTEAQSRPAATSFLSARGSSIVNEQGEEVRLRGVNIGSWLLIEPWMLRLDGQEGIEAEKDIWDLMERRFGSETKLELIRLHRNNFFTEEDVRRIAEAGLNSLRVPLWWRATDDVQYDGSFTYLDRCISWCSANGIYVIMDLHGAPGGQSSEARIIGERADSELWKNEKFRKQTIDWWRRVATRYRDEPAVAGYDLLNEAYTAPMPDLIAFNDEMYRDTRHLIFMQDGLLGFHRLPKPDDMGWENVVYSFHYYPPGPTEGVMSPSVDFYKYNRMALHYGVPIYVGEFNSMMLERGGVSAFRRYCEAFDYFGWSWGFWTYKTIERNRDYNWGLYGHAVEGEPVDLNRAPWNEIVDAFKKMRTSELNPDRMMLAAVDTPMRWKPMHSDGKIALSLANGFLLAANDEQMRIEWGREEPNIGFWGQGDSMAWPVDIPEDGVYELGIHYANSSVQNRARVWVNGVHTLDAKLPNSGGWHSYRNHSLGALSLSQGRHIISISQAENNNPFINFKRGWIEKTDGQAQAALEKFILLSPVNMLPPPAASPLRVEWWRNPPNVGHWASGETVRWKISVGVGGNYQGRVTYSSPNEDARMEVRLGDALLFDDVAPVTGDWHSFRDLALGRIALEPGEHELSITWHTANPEGAGNIRLVRMDRE